MQLIHIVMLVCGALAAGLPQLEPALPPAASPYLKALTAVLVLLTSVLGAVAPAIGIGAKKESSS